MARKITSRLKIAGKLVAETPLHVGGYGDSPDTDLPLAQNGKGEWYVPGTSIAGVLRNWCEKNFQEQNNKAKKIIKDLFGPMRVPGKEEGHASFVLIEDATIENAKGILAEIRDGVGIDRFYGVAANKAKYDRAVLPRGTELDFQMTVEIPSRRDNEPENKELPENDIYFQRTARTKAVIGHLLKALTTSDVRFGAAKTRGLGRVKLENLSIKEQSFVGFEILNTLNGGGHLLTIADLKKADESTKPDSSPRLEIKIEWHPRLPVMVKAGYDGIGVDMLPLTSGVRDGELALCLPGSSIKGVLRSHAERIMRTLLDCEDKEPKFRTKGKDFHDQIDSIPLTEKLFGARSKSKDNNNGNPATTNKGKGNTQAKPGLGALAIDDCYAKPEHSMSTDAWRKVEIARVNNDESSARWELTQALEEIPNANFRINHHVAIDRWTGGASEGALYSTLVPIPKEDSWEAMRFTFDFRRIEKESQLPALMLLLLVLRDVAENRLPFVFATNRGMGEIEVENICLKGAGFESELSCLNTSSEDGLVLSKGKFADLDKGLKETLKTEWEAWRNNQ